MTTNIQNIQVQNIILPRNQVQIIENTKVLVQVQLMINVLTMQNLSNLLEFFQDMNIKNWAIQTAYSKTVNSTNNNYNDNFYFSPEWKVNQFFSLREVFSADIAKHRKKAEVVLSINPFGNKDSDRMRLEFGASQSYSNTNQVLRSQLKFSTNFKL